MISRRGISLHDYLNSLLLKDALNSTINTQDSKEIMRSDEISAIRNVEVGKFSSNIHLIPSGIRKPPFNPDDELSDQINIAFPLPPKRNTPEFDFTKLTLTDLDGIIKNMVTEATYLNYLSREKSMNLSAYHNISNRIKFIIYVQNQ